MSKTDLKKLRDQIEGILILYGCLPKAGNVLIVIDALLEKYAHSKVT